MVKNIKIFDTTLRDGEQTPGVSLNIQEKLEIAKQLERLGVNCIEAGFPAASNGDFEAVKAIAKKVRKPIIVGLTRASKEDINRAWDALQYAERPRIHTFIATSDIHMEYKLKMKPDEVLKRAVEAVKYAKSLGPNVEVEFSPEDGTRTRVEFLYKILEAVIDAGADVINIPDTVGYSTPGEFGAFIAGIKKNVYNINKAEISIHCHNDLGLAVANSLAGIENGAIQVECAINGLGERAGNASLEEFVMALKTRKNFFQCETCINTEHIIRTSNLVSRITGIHVQPNKAIVGANAFAHESGIHQHGVLSHRETYEIMTPESVGLKKNLMVLGKHSGRHAFEDRLKELGYTHLGKEEINIAFKKFKDLADKKKNVSDGDIEAIIVEDIFQIPETYNLEYFQISSGNKMVNTATVGVKFEGKTIEEAACGHGPVDAVFKAIEKAIGRKVILKDYFLKAIGGGKDALGEVVVKIDRDSKVFIGNGISTDVIEASAKAFINALNKMNHKVG
jgi:2-isopropylmalate synthase